MSTVETYQNMATRGRAPSDAEGYGSHESHDSRSPLSTFNFLKNLNPDKKQTKDGQPQKRRGPKPDAKPALTRRQELNRQAQRTHRERKEQYIKALEHEVMRLKELFGSTTRERDAFSVENRKLKELLAANGIVCDVATHTPTFSSIPGHYDGSSSGSISGSYRQDTNSSGLSPPPPLSAHGQPPMPVRSAAQIPNRGLDYDQMGIDFVLTLESPCKEHMQYLVVRSHNADGKPFNHPMERPDDMESEHMCGHALMATCPPMTHVMEKPAENYPHKMPDLALPDLLKLMLQTSSQLPGMEGGEITPVKAWLMILQNERINEMIPRDFEIVKADLMTKVRCYGFGAVMEEFEVYDALSSLFAGKDSMPINGLVGMPQQVMIR